MLSESITPADSVLNIGVTVDKSSNFKNTFIQNVSLLFIPYPRFSPNSPVYLTFRCQNHWNSSSKQHTWLLQFPALYYCKEGSSKTSTCTQLFGKGSPAFSSFFLPNTASEIIALARYTYRIIFKICPVTYQVLSSTQPAYLNSLLALAKNPRQFNQTINQ